MNRLYIYGNSYVRKDSKEYKITNFDNNISAHIPADCLETIKNFKKIASDNDLAKLKFDLNNLKKSSNPITNEMINTIISNFIDGSYIADDVFPIKVNNYNDFLDNMNIKKNEANLSWNYTIFKFDDNAFVIFRSNIVNKNPKPYMIYSVENDCMFKLWKKILKLENRDARFFIVSESTYNTFLCRKELLKVICKKEQLVNDGVELYSCFKKRKKNGKFRTIYAPNVELKEVLRGANFFLQHVYDDSNRDFQVAYKKGKSVLNNAERHQRYQHTVNIDLSDFFPSCKRELVSKVLDAVFKGFNAEFLKNSFLDAILINDGLFIGCPVSGCLANAVISTPVKYLYNMCNKIGLEFSVYADDMSFSSDSFIPVKMVEALFTDGVVRFERKGKSDKQVSVYAAE